MQREDRRPLNVRALLASTGAPFAVAGYGPREAIFVEGDTGGSVMYIERGHVRLAVTARSGKAAVYGVVRAGAFLGEETLAGHLVRRQTAIAMTVTDVLVVERGQMVRLLRTQPGLSDRFMAHLLKRSTRLEAGLIDQLLYSSEQRLAHTLLVLANCDERGPTRAPLPDVSQEIIAEMVGTTRSRVNFFMGKFKKLGFIEETSGVLHINPCRLHIVVEGHRDASRGASPAIPLMLTSEKGYWPLAG